MFNGLKSYLQIKKKDNNEGEEEHMTVSEILNESGKVHTQLTSHIQKFSW
jgi:hypothetical protein